MGSELLGSGWIERGLFKVDPFDGRSRIWSDKRSSEAANPNFRQPVGYERSLDDYGSGVEGDRCSMYPTGAASDEVGGRRVGTPKNSDSFGRSERMEAVPSVTEARE